jgi:hypothetical protein
LKVELDIFETPFYIIITNIIVSELESYFLSMKLSSANELLVGNYSHDQTKPLRVEMVHFDQRKILFTRFLGLHQSFITGIITTEFNIHGCQRGMAGWW